MQQTDAPGLVPQAKRILEEHRQLQERLEKIRSALSAPRESERAAVWLSDLAACLRELLPFLRAHFDQEEEGGLFERIQEVWPHAARACTRLQGEHGALLARLESLGAECEKAPLAEEELLSLAVRVRSLSADLASHEGRENELLCGSLDDAVAAQD